MAPTATARIRSGPASPDMGADYIADQLKNFKDGKRANPVMMPNDRQSMTAG